MRYSRDRRVRTTARIVAGRPKPRTPARQPLPPPQAEAKPEHAQNSGRNTLTIASLSIAISVLAVTASAAAYSMSIANNYSYYDEGYGAGYRTPNMSPEPPITDTTEAAPGCADISIFDYPSRANQHVTVSKDVPEVVLQGAAPMARIEASVHVGRVVLCGPGAMLIMGENATADSAVVEGAGCVVYGASIPSVPDREYLQADTCALLPLTMAPPE